jgi:sugar phosphate isomerase/epimerase
MTNLQQTTRRGFLARSAQLGAATLVAPHLLASSAAMAADAKPKGWQIGCYTRPWDKQDYRVALDAIAEAGFKYVGLMTTNSKSHLVISADSTLEEAQEVRAEVKKRGLEVVSIYGGGIPVHKSLEEGIAGLRKLIDACVAAGCPSLLMGGMGAEKLYETYYKAIAECCDYAAEKGLGMTLKPHGGLNATGAQLRKAIELVNKPNFSIWYDAGNIFFYSDGKLNPVDDAPSVAGLVTGWCVKDFTMEAGPPLKKEVRVTPGTGMVDFKAVLAQLKKGGFTGGPLVVETLTPGELPQLLEEAKKANKFVQDLVANS